MTRPYAKCCHWNTQKKVCVANDFEKENETAKHTLIFLAGALTIFVVHFMGSCDRC